MAVIDQRVTDRFAIYNGDSAEMMQSLPAGSVDFSIYSPPFAQPGGGALYHYSSSPRDLSNARTFDEFLAHYGFILENLFRATKPASRSLRVNAPSSKADQTASMPRALSAFATSLSPSSV